MPSTTHGFGLRVMARARQLEVQWNKVPLINRDSSFNLRHAQSIIVRYSNVDEVPLTAAG